MVVSEPEKYYNGNEFVINCIKSLARHDTPLIDKVKIVLELLKETTK